MDYAIGNYMTLKDPAVSPPTGCTYSTSTSGTGGGLLDCVSPWNGVLQGYELGTIGGHSCTAVRIDGVNTGVNNILLDNLHFFNDAGNCIITNTTGFPDAIYVGVTVSGTVTLSSSLLDGNSSTWDTTYGSCSFGSNCNPTQFDLGGANHKIIEYSGIQNLTGRPVQGGNGAGGSTLIEYSWIQKLE